MVLLGAPGASASTTIGETFTPTAGPVFFDGAGTTVQEISPDNAYWAPSAGVITSWSYQAPDSATPPMKLKIHRVLMSTPDDSHFIVGESAMETPAPGSLNTFPTRIPVWPSDMLGLTLTGATLEARDAPGYFNSDFNGDPTVGTTAGPYSNYGSRQMDLSAQLEADADGDGYGDETQDECPTDASTHGTCLDTTAPDTTITSGPTKTDSKRAAFGFSSTEQGSTFQCKLTSKKVKKAAVKQYGPCTSKKKYKGLTAGKYKFFVFSTDGAGNPDPTPAQLKLRVVAKK
jgi:hypothetical protein